MVGRVFGAMVQPPVAVPPGITIRTGRWVPALGGLLSGHRQPAAAVTLGRTIVVHPKARLTERLLRHEVAHVEQWRRSPLLFPLQYAMQHLRYGYRDNPFEIEARAAERIES
ncbi:MAG: DUF4157 domain-containing protein [Gemmatimonadota bacterium]